MTNRAGIFHASHLPQLMVESLEDVERRMQPGSIKHAVFAVSLFFGIWTFEWLAAQLHSGTRCLWRAMLGALGLLGLQFGSCAAWTAGFKGGGSCACRLDLWEPP